MKPNYYCPPAPCQGTLKHSFLLTPIRYLPAKTGANCPRGCFWRSSTAASAQPEPVRIPAMHSLDAARDPPIGAVARSVSTDAQAPCTRPGSPCAGGARTSLPRASLLAVSPSAGSEVSFSRESRLRRDEGSLDWPLPHLRPLPQNPVRPRLGIFPLQTLGNRSRLLKISSPSRPLLPRLHSRPLLVNILSPNASFRRRGRCPRRESRVPACNVVSCISSFSRRLGRAVVRFTRLLPARGDLFYFRALTCSPCCSSKK